MSGIVLQDANGIAWQVDFLPNGTYESTSLGSVPAPTSILINDYSSPRTWQLTISIGGTQILVTAYAFTAGTPTEIFGSNGFAFVVDNGSLGKIVASPPPPPPPGIGFIFNDILSDVSYVLVEPLVSTTLGTGVTSGTQTVTPASMQWIYVGAILLVGVDEVNLEPVTVTATTPTTFTAIFANSHPSTDPVFGATFPSGQTSQPLFTQQEMINYLTEVQNDFLLRVRPVFAVSQISTVLNLQYYLQPDNCIYLERIAIFLPGGFGAEGFGVGPFGGIPYGEGFLNIGNGGILDLYETTQSNLDLMDPLWQSNAGNPAQWYRDQINTAMFGLYPRPSNISTLELWYSIRGASTGNTLNTPLTVPNIFEQFMVFGVLARCFSKDGEFRDPDRAKYFEKRYQLGVLISLKFMSGAGVKMLQGARNDPDFSPMPVAAGAK